MEERACRKSDGDDRGGTKNLVAHTKLSRFADNRNLESNARDGFWGEIGPINLKRVLVIVRVLAARRPCARAGMTMVITVVEIGGGMSLWHKKSVAALLPVRL
jgi:hypothetical protein